ncbi:MAG: 4-hydroxy-tetrahydrodipicolinate synthase [Proteobacteria bacterium]|nr:4-hydroxy-tetrahydrodipicolinate synthase [Pseudomonadota bacterium]MDA1331377.1 4-hydroxy-tetrahydrodipicolinate synthase [Pseudomonadota bacterium]
MLVGSLVAIVTPMYEDGSLDYVSFGRLIDWHIDCGTRGIVVVGTTGESPTVAIDEHTALIEYAVKHVAGRVPVVAGTGANSTAEAIELSVHAQKVGADMSLSVVPYYNKPTQEGLYRHFRKIAESVDIPLILYNVPSRTIADLQNDTVCRLAEVDNVIGIKDATADMARGLDLINRTPKDFVVYSGDDATFMALMMLGSQGVISVTANVVPKEIQLVCDAILAGDYQKARSVNDQLSLLNTNLFVEANPIPVKWALQRMGKIRDGIRLPLTNLDDKFHQTVLESLSHAGIEL